MFKNSIVVLLTFGVVGFGLVGCGKNDGNAKGGSGGGGGGGSEVKETNDTCNSSLEMAADLIYPVDLDASNPHLLVTKKTDLVIEKLKVIQTVKGKVVDQSEESKTQLQKEGGWISVDLDKRIATHFPTKVEFPIDTQPGVKPGLLRITRVLPPAELEKRKSDLEAGFEAQGIHAKVCEIKTFSDEMIHDQAAGKLERHLKFLSTFQVK